jgi:dCMP deaminase
MNGRSLKRPVLTTWVQSGVDGLVGYTPHVSQTVSRQQKAGSLAERLERPDWDQYLMGIAIAVRARACCTGNRIGAIIALDNRVVASGYNGTPFNTENCVDGGCDRCANHERYESGQGYDLCICVHAEQNAILQAARFGIAVQDALIYTTMRPCFGCTKELIQAGIRGVRYLHEWRHPDDEVWSQYERLQARLPAGVKPVALEDENAVWAVTTRRDALTTGHDQ